MKSFLKYTLATITGIIISSFIIIIILVAIASSLISSSDKEVILKPNSILKLTLNKPIIDRSEDNPIKDFNFSSMESEQKIGLNDLIENIHKAKNDSSIKGIYLEISSIAARMATIEEIRNALLDFKKSGKFIVSYSDFYTQSSYYLASVANHIWINPQGSIAFAGARAEIMFLKGTLDKLGVEPQIIRHGKFKSAIEPLILDKMSDANREQTQTYLNTIWNQLINGVAKERGISLTKLNALADRLSLTNADSCLIYHAVDKLYYKDEVLENLHKLSKSTEKDPVFISLSKYMKVPSKNLVKKFSKPKIAVIYAMGDVVMGNEGEGSVSAERISKAIRQARKDSTIKAIVFRINSPGGSALASDIIWREVSLATKVKPVVASMGGLAASGGYYIACAADTIVANPNTLTGSIGVFGVLLNAKELLNKKLGITTDVVKTNDHADMPSFSRPLSASEKEYFQFEIDRIYDTFISHVAEGRNMSKQKVDDIGQGRIWSGRDAQRIGLVDILGGLDTALNIAARMAKLDDYRTVNLPELKDPFEQIINDLMGTTKAYFLKNQLGEEKKYLELYKKLMNYQGIQARLPFEIEIY